MVGRQAATLERFQYSQLHMGVRVNITCYARNSETAERACTAAFARFAELEAIMSDYRPDSELMRLCSRTPGVPVRVSKELFAVLERGQEIARRSGGAFDVTCGPVVKLWRAARKSGKMPSLAALADARRRTGYRHLVLRKASSTAVLKVKGMQLDLGGIAKGHACDEALRVLFLNHVDRAMVEAGGDIAASGPPPDEKGWAIARPGGRAVLAHQAISTSGDAEQFVEIAGKRYSHIVDPRTGIGLTNRIQVTVLAPKGLTTDPLATALCVLGETKGKMLAKRYGARVWFSGQTKPERR
jgi:FAD:protein FMN transferase